MLDKLLEADVQNLQLAQKYIDDEKNDCNCGQQEHDQADDLQRTRQPLPHTSSPLQEN